MPSCCRSSIASPRTRCLEISLKSGSFSQVEGLAETSWAKEIAERHEAWDRDLPDDERKLWDFLLGLDEASRKALFAHCVSLTLNAVIEPWNKRPRALAHADVLAARSSSTWSTAGWTPTVDNYLGRVTKARILQAVREARGEDFRAADRPYEEGHHGPRGRSPSRRIELAARAAASFRRRRRRSCRSADGS